MTQKQFRKLRFLFLIAILTYIPFLLLNKSGYEFFKSHVHEYWLFTRLPFVLFPLIAYLGSKLNQNRIFFIALTYWVTYILLYGVYTKTMDWLPLTAAISISSMTLPLSMILILYKGEGKMFSPKGGQLAAISLLPLLILSYFYTIKQEFCRTILYYHGQEMGGVWNLPILSMPLVISELSILSKPLLKHSQPLMSYLLSN